MKGNEHTKVYRRAMWGVYIFAVFALVAGYLASKMGLFVMDEDWILAILMTSFFTWLTFKLAKELLQ